MIGIEGTYALNGGRGRATPQCVWSIHRIDAQLGRYLDINSAWRDPQEQERLYSAYRSYVNGNGPWAPIALPPEQSVHCKGEAIDTDDNNAAMTRILNENGWFHTVFRNGVLVEPWHYEYDYKRDKYFGGTPASEDVKPLEWDEMATEDQVMNALRRLFFEGSVTNQLALIVKNELRSQEYTDRVALVVKNEMTKSLTGDLSIIPLKEDGKNYLWSKETGKKIAVNDPGHISLIQRAIQNNGNDLMSSAQLDIVNTYVSKVHDPNYQESAPKA